MHLRNPPAEDKVFLEVVFHSQCIGVVRRHVVRSELRESEQPQLRQPVLTHALQALGAVEDGLVLRGEGDEVVALVPVELEHALEGQVVGLGGTAGEDNLLLAGPDE